MAAGNTWEKWKKRLRFMLLISPLWYLLSSGPVMAMSFRLRDTMHIDEYYGIAFGLYFPLVWLERHLPVLFCPWCLYLEWWCKLFHTTGPG